MLAAARSLSETITEGVPDSGSPAFRLLNDYQHDFPLVARPFADIAAKTGLGEPMVLGAYQRWLHAGVVSRVGPVFAPQRMGASALAALSAPVEALEAIAQRVNAVAEINHNYQREHAFNLWFVITAASAVRRAAIVAGIERDTGCPVIVLPLAEAFHIDLGFDLGGARRAGAHAPDTSLRWGLPPASALPAHERRLLAALQDGLPLEPAPFHALGRRVGLAEGAVIGFIRRWLGEGLLKRFGVVVRHHELGYRANAMCVWDIPDEQIGAVGRALAAEPSVTLCYRRERALPHWRHNLFCMIHGQHREAVLGVRHEIVARLGLERWPGEVLFSTRRFKQQGARYLPTLDAEVVHE
jgi:DNA-binding Lrp family transcriptional regulator